MEKIPNGVPEHEDGVEPLPARPANGDARPINPPCVRLTLVNKGSEVPWAGFQFFQDTSGEVGTRILNPNVTLDARTNDKFAPAVNFVRRRFVSGRTHMFRKRKEGFLVGHYLRVVDHTTGPGVSWLVADMVALLVELLHAGYSAGAQAKALQRVANAYPVLAGVFGALIRWLSVLVTGGCDGGILKAYGGPDTIEMSSATRTLVGVSNIRKKLWVLTCLFG